MSCPDEILSALVDGELGHADRDRVHAHLANCAACRTEVEELRALKVRLSWEWSQTPGPSADLTERLLSLTAPATAGMRRGDLGPSRPVPVGPRRATRFGRPVDARARRLRRRAVGGGLVALGLGAALALGGPRPTEPTVPIDPGSDSFVVDYVNSTVEVPLVDPVDAAMIGSGP